MNNSLAKEFKYYDQRVKELDDLLKQAKSRTLSELIIKSKELTEKSLELLIQIQKSTIRYLTDRNDHRQKRIQQFNSYLDLYREKVSEFKTLTLAPEMRKMLSEFYSNTLSVVEDRFKLEADVHGLTVKTFTLCAKEFDRILLQLIFKPRNGQFNYGTVIDVLNYIASKLLPGLDEAKLISNLPTSIKKRQFAKSGDKILTYIEQYIDVLEKWQLLGDAYLKINAE